MLQWSHNVEQKPADWKIKSERRHDALRDAEERAQALVEEAGEAVGQARIEHHETTVRVRRELIRASRR